MKFLTFPGLKLALSHPQFGSRDDSTTFYLFLLEPDKWTEFLSIKGLNRRLFLCSLYRYALSSLRPDTELAAGLKKAADDDSWAKVMRINWNERQEERLIESVSDCVPDMTDSSRLTCYRQTASSGYFSRLSVEYLTGGSSPAPPTMFPLIKKFHDTYNQT